MYSNIRVHFISPAGIFLSQSDQRSLSKATPIPRELSVLTLKYNVLSHDKKQNQVKRKKNVAIKIPYKCKMQGSGRDVYI